MDPSDDDFAQLRAHLARALRRACPPWLESRRDDLLQLAMLKVANVWKREEPATFNTSYLYRVAHAVVVDEMRRAQWRRETALPDGAGGPEPATAEPGPEKRAWSREIAQGIGECLSRLAEPRRLAVTLHLQGYSLEEAAGVLGWTAKRTENMTYRGMADLRTCLAGKGVKP